MNQPTDNNITYTAVSSHQIHMPQIICRKRLYCAVLLPYFIKLTEPYESYTVFAKPLEYKGNTILLSEQLINHLLHFSSPLKFPRTFEKRELRKMNILKIFRIGSESHCQPELPSCLLSIWMWRGTAIL